MTFMIHIPGGEAGEVAFTEAEAQLFAEQNPDLIIFVAEIAGRWDNIYGSITTVGIQIGEETVEYLHFSLALYLDGFNPIRHATTVDSRELIDPQTERDIYNAALGYLVTKIENSPRIQAVSNES